MRNDVRSLIGFLAIGITALLLRISGIAHYVHTDEINFWIDRSHTFLRALQTGDFASTAISTHPGVTTMWLGSAGITLRRMLFEQGLLTHETFPTILTLMRLPVIATHSACILLSYLLLRRLFPPAIATLAAFLWATDPFVIAFNRILHVDALTGSFATVSLLAACSIWNVPPTQTAQQRNQVLSHPWLWLIVSGSSAALALLSKSPGIAVLPVVGLLTLASIVTAQHKHRTAYILRLLIWGVVCIATVVLVWPAVWADIGRVWELLHVGVEVEGGSRHVVGNYFLGRPIPVPGILYYPVVLAIRTTPWTLAGLLLLPFALSTTAKPWRSWRLGSSIPTLVRSTTGSTGIHKDMMSSGECKGMRTLAVLSGFVIVFIIGMSLFPKKLDRYMVPVLPAIDILASAGIFHTVQWLRRCLRVSKDTSHDGKGVVTKLLTNVRGSETIAIALIVAMALLNALWWNPHQIAYFNQALGGLPMGVRTVLVGEGEGLGDVARWLNEQPDITGVVATSTMESSLQAFLRQGAQAVPERGETMDEKTGYVIVYIRHMQQWQNTVPPPYNQFYERMPPTHSITIHGVDYAQIWQVPPPVEHLVQATFGESIRLRGYDVDTTTLRTTGVVSLTTQWQQVGPPIAMDENPMLFVHVFNADGAKIAHVDVPPAGPSIPVHNWEPQRYVTWVHPIPMPMDTPAGDYYLALGVYRPDDFSRLPLTLPDTMRDTKPYERLDDGPDALWLKPVRIVDK